jgi:hypothetical protein
MDKLLSPFLLHLKKLLPKGVVRLLHSDTRLMTKPRPDPPTPLQLLVRGFSAFLSSNSVWSLSFIPILPSSIPGLSSCLFGRLICWSRPINLPSHHSKYQPASVVCSNAWKQARLWPFAKSHLVPGKSSPWLFSLPQLWR